MFLLNSRVGKDWAGPFFPPPLGSYLSIYLSVLGLNYFYTESEHSWLTYLKEKFKLQQFSQMILLKRGWGKTGPAHSFPPLLFSNLSVFLSVFRLNLFLHWIWNSWLTYLKEKFKLQSFSQMILLNRGWGKTGLAHSFPPLLFSNLSVFLSVFRFNLLLHCIWTLMIVVS